MLNQRLANAGATRVLLHDIAMATDDHIQKLKESLEFLTEDDEDGDTKTNKRRRKTALRVIHSSYVARTLYTFAAHIAYLSLEHDITTVDSSTSNLMDPKLMLKAIERSRMVVSTFGNFLHTKVDRAMKSTLEYTKGKAIKAIIATLASSNQE